MCSSMETNSSGNTVRFMTKSTSGGVQLPSANLLPLFGSVKPPSARTSYPPVKMLHNHMSNYVPNASAASFNRFNQRGSPYSPSGTPRRNYVFSSQDFSYPPAPLSVPFRRLSIDADSISPPGGMASAQVPGNYRRASTSSMQSVEDDTSNASSQQGSPIRSDFVLFSPESTTQSSHKPHLVQYVRQPGSAFSAISVRNGGRNKHFCRHPYCGWSFKRYEHLKRHMLVHTGERSYVCDHEGCGKTFSRSDNFAAHCRSHSKKTLHERRLGSGANAAGHSENEHTHGSTSGLKLDLNRLFNQDGNRSGAKARHGDDHDGEKELADEGTTNYQSPPHSPHKPISNSNSSIYMLLNKETDHQYQDSVQHRLPSTPTTPPHSTSNQWQAGSPYSVCTNNRYPSGTQALSLSSAIVAPETSKTPMYYAHSPSSPLSPSSPPSSYNFINHHQPSTRTCGTTQKNHVCSVPHCLKRFKRLEHLKRHQRTHTMERPFECTFPGCRKTFSRSDNLAQHAKTHQRQLSRGTSSLGEGMGMMEVRLPQPQPHHPQAGRWVSELQ
ncbi:hypothetical protein BC936DRAFT_136894 [Jimgerdemannia flammicorona]|uniref:C2H2-type domain-containing protein n=1 Tax=Jimgerdemannia flammicorona TaxID=994334 RepID=A0A433CYJ3_9FUNG|nr:hypothetical protein BC936DRAFT_136894 [Jimgerdemannia flammicorona]